MQVSERLKKEAKTERQKLKDMSFRDKLWYIWEYYKFHILAVLIGIGVLWVIGTSIYRSTFSSELYCIYINNRSDQELNTDILTVDFHDYMGFTDKQQINTESSFISYGNDSSEYSYASMAKISALVASKELDVMISDEENFEHYASLSAFSDLETLLPADVLELVKDRLYYAADEAGNSYAYGILLDDTAFASKSNLAIEPCIMGLISNSTKTDNCIALIRYIFSE